jgi:hypothetical protein
VSSAAAPGRCFSASPRLAQLLADAVSLAHSTVSPDRQAWTHVRISDGRVGDLIDATPPGRSNRCALPLPCVIVRGYGRIIVTSSGAGRTQLVRLYRWEVEGYTLVNRLAIETEMTGLTPKVIGRPPVLEANCSPASRNGSTGLTRTEATPKAAGRRPRGAARRPRPPITDPSCAHPELLEVPRSEPARPRSSGRSEPHFRLLAQY